MLKQEYHAHYFSTNLMPSTEHLPHYTVNAMGKQVPPRTHSYLLLSILSPFTHTHTHTHTPLNSALSPHQVQNLLDPQKILLIQLERRVFPAGIFTSSESLSSLNLFVKLKQMRVTYKLILRSPQSYRNNLMLWRTPAY